MGQASLSGTIERADECAVVLRSQMRYQGADGARPQNRLTEFGAPFFIVD